MDVARIEAISPKQIDWRRLTAKEIIKYEQQGMDVPMQYLQWAQEFVNSIYSDDKTTYQTASSKTSNITTETPQSPEVEGTDSSEEQDAEEPEKTAAQQKREDMQNSGDSLIKQAVVFIGDSRESNKAVESSATIISAVENSSINEIEALENYMNDLLSKAEAKQNEFKDEIGKLNDDKSDKASFAKINQLQQELQRYGMQGQAQVSTSEGVLSNYDTVLNEQTSIIDNAKDFGTETVNIGSDILQQNRIYSLFWLFEWIIGKTAVKTGEATVKNADKTEGLQNQAIDTNSSNLQNISSYKSEVESKTGVQAAASPPQTQKDDTTNNKNETDNDVSAKKEEEEKIATNDGTDTTDKVSTNIDEILKRKIRKGENVDNPTV